MPLVSLLLNILWLVFGGVWMAIAWLIAAVIMAITIVGLPWAWAAFNIASGYAADAHLAARRCRAPNMRAGTTSAPGPWG